MKCIIFITLLFLLTSSVTSKFCTPKDPFTKFQDNIDFSRLQGRWQQRYYLNRWYGGTYCMEMNVTNVDDSMRTVDMMYSFYLYEPSIGDQMAPYMFYARDNHALTKAAFEEKQYAKSHKKDSKRDYIGDHIATDYDMFMIVVYCDTMSQRYIGDVFIREGFPELDVKQLRSIKRILRSRIMGRIRSSRKPWCDEYK